MSTEEVTIRKIAKELLEFKGKCPNVDVETISRQLISLDNYLSKYEKEHKITKE